MAILSKLALGAAITFFSLPALGAVVESAERASSANTELTPRNTTYAQKAIDDAGMILLAKKKRKKRKGRKAREKHIRGEAKQRGRDSKNIDFDAANIGGATKAPMSSLINQNKADKNYDFIKIRLRWHPEMIQSASSLNAKK